MPHTSGYRKDIHHVASHVEEVWGGTLQQTLWPTQHLAGLILFSLDGEVRTESMHCKDYCLPFLQKCKDGK